MTACVNKKHSRRVALAISASLVGALSLGAAATPVFAANEGIDTLATIDEEFSNGEVAAAVDSNGKPLDLENLEFVKNGSSKGIKVTQVKLGSGKVISGEFTVACYSYTDSNDNGVYDDGEVLGSSMATFPATVGRYVAKVTSNDYPGGEIWLDFGVVSKSLKGATLYNKEADKGLGYDTFTYSGSQLTFGNGSIGLALDGQNLDHSGNFSAAYFNADGESTKVLYSGTYTVVITGLGDYEGSAVKLELTVDPFNLAGANVELSAGLATAYTGKAIIPTLKAVEGLDSLDGLKLTPDDGVALEKGAHAYTVSVDEDATDAEKASFTGEAKVSLDVVGKVIPAADFLYDGKIFNGTNVPATIDLSDEDGVRFDASEVSVKGIDDEYVDIQVVNAETGEPADVDDVNTPGKWNVTVRVNADALRYEKGGASQTVTIETTNQQISTATTYFTYTKMDGTEKTGESFSDTYCGEDLLANLNVVVKDKSGATIPEGDYDVVVKKGDTQVDSIVDAGNYTVYIESDKYDVEDAEYCTIKVSPLTLAQDKVKPSNYFAADQKWIAYTGSEIVPVYQYLAYTDEDGVQVWKELPSDVYTVSYVQGGKVVKLQEVGTYTANFNVSDEDGNFSTTAFTKGVEVKEGKVFSDVPTDHWAAKEVYQALANSYMSGYGETNFFGPADTLTRAQAAVVLYNMAGGKQLDPENEAGIIDQYKAAADAAFSDVDSSYWGAAEIGWAVKTGVVKGNPDGTFAPDQEITREQFAIMLANYAKLTGSYSAVDADEVLSAVAGGDEVDGWAKAEVAWAVSEGVMGKGADLDPLGEIERAQVAIMAVRFQPEAMADDDFVRPTK